MNDQIKIIKLPAMHVACARAFSTTPEKEAIEKLMTWAKQKDILHKPHRFFGYNVPGSLKEGQAEYGYEVVITVEPGVQADGEISIKELPAARYAVASVCGVDHITSGWQDLMAWIEKSPYTADPSIQCLEEHLSPVGASDDQFRLDLFEPLLDDRG